MITNDLIDVVITCYNQESTILRAVQSVLKGNEKYLGRLFVVDDGSTDESRNILQSNISQYPQVELLCKQNGGACEARNYGISRSSSKWIAFLDGDDEWKPGKLECQIDALKQSNDAVLSYTSLEKHYVVTGRVTTTVPINYTGAGTHSIKDFVANGGPVILSTVVARREDVVAVGMFDPDANRGEDIDLWFKLFMRGDVVFVEKPLVLKYDYGESLGTFDIRRVQDHLFVTSRFCKANRLPTFCMHGRYYKVWKQCALNAFRVRDYLLFIKATYLCFYYKILYSIARNK